MESSGAAGVPPTGKPVVAPFVVIAGVEDGKISYEHIYWDQASVLVQVGLLDPKGLPVVGAENARRMQHIGSSRCRTVPSVRKGGSEPVAATPPRPSSSRRSPRRSRCPRRVRRGRRPSTRATPTTPTPWSRSVLAESIPCVRTVAAIRGATSGTSITTNEVKLGILRLPARGTHGASSRSAPGPPGIGPGAVPLRRVLMCNGEMMRILAAALLTLLVADVAARAQEPEPTPAPRIDTASGAATDRAIERRLRGIYRRDRRLDGVRITVSDGVVELSGETLPDEPRARAVRLARQVQGVVEVEDRDRGRTRVRRRIAPVRGSAAGHAARSSWRSCRCSWSRALIVGDLLAPRVRSPRAGTRRFVA